MMTYPVSWLQEGKKKTIRAKFWSDERGYKLISHRKEWWELKASYKKV